MKPIMSSAWGLAVVLISAVHSLAAAPGNARELTTLRGHSNWVTDTTPEAGSVAPGAGSEVRLESDYLPLAMLLKGDPSKREIRSVRFAGKVPPEGDGDGEIWLDTRLAELNAFGDVVQRFGPEPAPIRVELRYVAKGVDPTTTRDFLRESRTSQGFRLYDLVFPGGVLEGRLKLVLGTATLGLHRLLADDAATPSTRQITEVRSHIVPLHGDPVIASALPDAPLAQEIDLTGYYTAADGVIHRLEVQGSPGGAGKLALDPNYITFDSFGEPVMFTLIGFQPHEITLKPAEDADPLGQGRRLYWAVSKDPQDTNRVAVVLGRTEIGPHRVLLYRGDQVTFIVPAHLADRRRQEIQASEFVGLSPGEQQALTDLRRAIGYGFRCQTEKGQAVALDFTGNTESVPPEGLLARLPHLHAVRFDGGRFPATGLADLGRLAQLRILTFSSVEFPADGLGMLKDLGQLESLTFWDCRGITDEGVSHLAGLTGLKNLRFQDERLLRRPPEAGTCITDAGVAYLKQLVRLEHLDLFGHDLSDASVGILSAMTELQTLTLSGHAFTDAGLEGLARLLKLRELRLFETAVTTNGVARLKARLPELQIQAWSRDQFR